MTATVVVGVDASKAGLAALDWAVDEARRRGATLRIVHAWMPPAFEGYTVPAVDPSVFEEAGEHALAAAIQRARSAGTTDVRGTLVAGSAAAELIDASREADLVVVGSRRHGAIVGMLLGSIADAVVHHASCPVVVVPQD